MEQGKPSIDWEQPVGMALEIKHLDDTDTSIIWTTHFTERQVVRRMVDFLAQEDQTKHWEAELWQVIVNMQIMDVEEFLATEGPSLAEDWGIIRFNVGPEPGVGFSVSMLIDKDKPGVLTLDGVFSRQDKALATKIIALCADTEVPHLEQRLDDFEPA